MKNNKEKTKEQRVNTERNRLNKIFKNLEPNKLKAAKALIERAAFITVSLQDLEDEINQSGYIEKYQNGKDQTGVKISAAANTHISFTKNLNTIMKQLLDIVPAEQKKSKLAELMRDD